MGYVTVRTIFAMEAVPRSQHRRAKAAPAPIWNAATRADAIAAFNQFVDTYAIKYPKAVEKLTKNRGALLAFYDVPAEHRLHVRTTILIESTFATTVRHRTSHTRNCLSRSTHEGTFTLANKGDAFAKFQVTSGCSR